MLAFPDNRRYLTMNYQPDADRTALRDRPAGTIIQYLDGVRLLGRGVALYTRTPGLLLPGALPVLLAAALFLLGFVGVLFFLTDLATTVTWFADDWADTPQIIAGVFASIAIIWAALLIGIVTFTSVTLTIGDPCYERISQQV